MCSSDKSAIALIARDDKSLVKVLAAKLIPSVRPDIAELKAIECAVTIAKESSWIEVDWLCNARLVVDQLNDSSEPSEWESWSLVKNLRDKLKDNNWTIS